MSRDPPHDTVSENDDKEVLVPEVLPPERGPHDESPPRSTRDRATRIFGPIIAGVIIDAIDFVTWGIPGLLIGFGVMFWICSEFKLPLWQRLAWSFGAAWYCAVPFTRFIPLGTLIGAYVQFREAR